MRHTPRDTPRDGEAGFTLIEVLIALALFSAIGIAGFSIVEGVMRVQAGTDRRLDRLAELQRAMHILTLDLQQVGQGGLVHDGGALVIRRPGDGGGDLAIRYGLGEEGFSRILTVAGGALMQPQILVAQVSGLEWQFYAGPDGWRPDWPPERAGAEALPLAVAAELTLAPGQGLAGQIRRIVQLPAEPAS